MPEPATPPVLPFARVALVHDWLTGMRGGEKVFEVFCELMPQADIFTLLHVPGSVSTAIERHRIITAGRIQNLPAASRIYRWALPMMPGAIESFDLSAYDLVVSSSHCVAKGVRPAPNALSVCYCHTPMRYMWDRFDDYFGRKPWPLRTAIGLQRTPLQAWDQRTANRVHRWLANSNLVRQRIQQHYHVPDERVEVVFPPVDRQRFAPGLSPVAELAPKSYDFVLSALVPYKKLDLAVVAAIRAGRHLVVAGRGGEETRLRRLAESTPGPGRATFLGPVSDAMVPHLYANARCFVFPGLEDFGITPLEATASGTPVVAFKAGGALDTVVDGLNGVFFGEQSADALAAALNDPRLDARWDTAAMLEHASGFDRGRFVQQVSRILTEAWSTHQVSEASFHG